MANSSSKALDKFMADFAKSFGVETIKVAAHPEYETLSTGSIALDKAMGAGGFVLGRITEVWGPPSGGKSSLTLISAGLALQDHLDKRVAYIDVEATFDGEWAEKLGVDLSRVDVIHPKTAEDVADMVKALTASGLYIMVILDSIGAMVGMKEFEKDAEEATVGIVAKVVTRMIKISTYYVRQNNLALVILNQLRANIGGYGVDTVAGGGFALDHSLTHKLYVKRGSAPYKVGTKEDERNVGYEMVVKVEKSKVCPEGRVARFGFFTEETEKYGPIGIDKAQEAFTMGVAVDVIQHSGIGYVFPDGEKIVASNDGVKRSAVQNAIEYLRSHPEWIADIRAASIKSVESELKFIEDTE